jgi:tetratricopeptide (TPR) repeat protein
VSYLFAMRSKAQPNYYKILGVGPSSPFREIKKAYYAKAKQHHPDLHNGSAHHEEMFKLVVQAFDVLSDPVQRIQYDKHLQNLGGRGDRAFKVLRSASIMDSPADDILEQLIVGNHVPRTATLMTIMIDLENTDRFLLFREGLNIYFKGHFEVALQIFERCLRNCSVNILYHFYVAECARKLGKFFKARKHYKRCLEIGATRTPVQHLHKVHRRLDRLGRENTGFVGKIYDWLSPAKRLPGPPSDESMVAETSRAMARMLKQSERKSSHRLLSERSGRTRR